MKSKQDLRNVFENGDKPKQEDFWEWQDSYWHKDEKIPKEKVDGIPVNLATVDIQTENGIIIGNVNTKEQVEEKITDAINNLKNNAPEAYDTLKEIADYIAEDTTAEAALIRLINSKLDKPNLTTGKIAKSNGSTLADSILSEGNGKIGVAIELNDTDSSRIKIDPLNQKFFNISTGNADSYPSSINGGDFFVAHGRYWYRPYPNSNSFGHDGANRPIKIGGFQIDYSADGWDFNKTQNFDTVVENNLKYGDSAIINTGMYYGNTILSAAPNSTGVDSRMYEGWLFSIRKASRVGVQYFIDGVGNFYVKSLGGQYHSNSTWGKALLDKSDKTTVVGSETNYPSAKFAVDSTNKGSLPAPRMTEVQKNAISSPTDGLMIYQTDGNVPGYYVRKNGIWSPINEAIVLNVPTDFTVNHVNSPASPTIPAYIQALQARLSELNTEKMQKFTTWNIKTLNDINNANITVVNNDIVNTYVQPFFDDTAIAADTNVISIYTNKILPRNCDWCIKFNVLIGHNGVPLFGQFGRVTKRLIGLFTAEPSGLIQPESYVFDGGGDYAINLLELQGTNNNSKKFSQRTATDTNNIIYTSNGNSVIPITILKVGDNILFQGQYGAKTLSEIYSASTIGSGDFGFVVSAAKPNSSNSSLGVVSNIRYYIFQNAV